MAKAALNPGAMSAADMAALLSRAGGRQADAIDESMIRADIERGAPTNDDGTINLLHYAAWLARESTNA